jgi:hypothetical protein
MEKSHRWLIGIECPGFSSFYNRRGIIVRKRRVFRVCIVDGWPAIANEADYSARHEGFFGLSSPGKSDIGKGLPFPTAMNTFSLLQLSLDQKIDRRDLEDAFQAQLLEKNFPTALVPDSELPLLPDSFHIQRIELNEESLVFTDSLGHSRVRPLAELKFLAAGVVSRLRFKSEWNQHLDCGIESTGTARLVTEHELYEESEMEFRLDFFFNTSPERQHAAACTESTIHYQDTILRLRDMEGLRGLATAMAALLPAERLSSFFRNPESHPSYRTLRNYQNEIRWYLRGLEAAVSASNEA